ncbi:MAG TPA: COX15/CtaA family protein [Caulobacteraceae bacterium]|nr:COX15/CtaA family protein [Caulobacteraceae bacterium]
MTSFLRSDRSRPVAVWLFCVAAMVFGMVIVGGATRLTGSGLSITEWKPISGTIPPLNPHAWLLEFQNYQRIPQYRYMNAGMTLRAFKGIYWWEWAHRLLGRVVGVVFGVPFLVFLAMRRLSARMIWRCVALFLLGGLQGLVGWWMVKSGLEVRVSVAPERLATHLGLALILYGALIWTGLEAWFGPPRPAPYRSRWPIAAMVLMGLVYLQCLLGALVAGNQAGLVYNDWPRMNGRWFPSAYLDGSLWRSLLHSQAAVQFDHRMLAYLVLATAIACAVLAARSVKLADSARGLFVALGVVTGLQAALGVITLISRAPLSLSAAHQALAAIVLAVAVSLAWRTQRA